MGGKSSKQQEEKKEQPQQQDDDDDQEAEAQHVQGELPPPPPGEQQKRPDSVSNLIAMVISNRSGPQKSNQNRPQIIVGEDPVSSRKQTNRKLIELIDLQAKVSQRAQTDKGKPLKIPDAGQIKLSSSILDLRFHRGKRQVELVRDLDNPVTSQLQWIIKKDQKCIQFTLLDRSIELSEEEPVQLKLKNKMVFFTTLSGGFIGVKVPPKKNMPGMNSSYFQQLESELRFLWESIKPIKSREAIKKDGIFSRYSYKSQMQPQALSEIYSRKWIKPIRTDQNEGDIWEVNSDDGKGKYGAKGKTNAQLQPKPKEQYKDVLFNQAEIQSYYHQDFLWPCLSKYAMRNEVFLNTTDGYKLDFTLKIAIISIESNADKLPEKVKKAVAKKQEDLMENLVKEFDDLSSTEFGKLMMTFQGS